MLILIIKMTPETINFTTLFKVSPPRSDWRTTIVLKRNFCFGKNDRYNKMNMTNNPIPPNKINK